ncbi:MAG TPA: helix-turn-helix domain-containing protein [Candidatus Solibacter sp.]|nr:helix-turn-helix domain-containing protein [Candidatus Solibacter sp.]
MSYHGRVIQGRTRTSPGQTVGEFGDKFRKAREAKSFSLDDVSNVTKIGARMLQAIEEEHFDRLPGGVFNRGFIRAYAKHLGLNAEEAVTDYLACLQQAQIDANQVWEPSRSAAPVANHPAAVATPPAPPAPQKPLPAYTKPVMKTVPATQVREELPGLQLPRAEHLRPPRQKFLDRQHSAFPWRLVAVGVLVIVLGTLFWMRRNRIASSSNPNPGLSSAPSSGAVSSSGANPNPSTQTQVSPEAAQWAAHNFGLDAQPNSASISPKTAPTAGVATPATTNPAPAKPAATNDDSNKDDSKKVSATHYGSDVTVRTFQPGVPPNPVPAQTQTPASAATQTPATATATTMSLTVRATETSWISITADGQPRAQETLIAPAHASIRATQQIVVKVGNAAGVTFLFNNQEIPAQGAEGEVKTFTFDSTGIHAQ